MNTHKNARLTFARRLGLVMDVLERELTLCAPAAAHNVSVPRGRPPRQQGCDRRVRARFRTLGQRHPFARDHQGGEREHDATSDASRPLCRRFALAIDGNPHPPAGGHHADHHRYRQSGGVQCGERFPDGQARVRRKSAPSRVSRGSRSVALRRAGAGAFPQDLVRRARALAAACGNAERVLQIRDARYAELGALPDLAVGDCAADADEHGGRTRTVMRDIIIIVARSGNHLFIMVITRCDPDQQISLI